MQWNRVKDFISSNPSDLVEVYFFDLDYQSWSKLFNWIRERLFLLDCQFGRLNIDELDLDLFWAGEMSYIAHIRMPSQAEYSLSIVETNVLMINIEISEINTENKFIEFLDDIIEIAKEIGCHRYIVCPEFEKEKAFVVNGVVV